MQAAEKQRIENANEVAKAVEEKAIGRAIVAKPVVPFIS
jgi:hypothetical protein